MSKVKEGQRKEFREMVGNGQISSEALQMLISDAYRLGLEQILRELRDQTEQIMSHIPERSWCPSVVTANIAKSLAYTRYFELALQRAKTIELRCERDEALSDIAVAYAKAEGVAGARRILRSVKIPRLKALTLVRIYEVSKDGAHIKLALQRIEEMDAGLEQDKTIFEIVKVLIDVSAFNWARQIIKKIHSDYWRCLSWAKMYKVSGIDDDLGFALQALGRINDSEYICLALARMYRVIGDSDCLVEARGIASGILQPTPRHRANLYTRIYEASLEDSDLSRALQLIRNVDEAGWRGSLYNFLVSVMIRHEDINNACEQAGNISYPYWCAKTWAEIFEATGKIDDIVEARKCIKDMRGEDNQGKAQVLSYSIQAVAKVLSNI